MEKKYLTFDVTPKLSDVISKGDTRPILDTGETYSTNSSSARTADFLRIIREIFDQYSIPVPVCFNYRRQDHKFELGTLNKARVTGQIAAGTLIPVMHGNSIIGVVPAWVG